MGNSLINAAREGNLPKVQKVCGDPKVNINYQENENGVTALMEAAHAGHVDIVAYLTNQGADVNLCSKLGVPAVVYAAARNRLLVVEYLVSRGADPGPIAHIRADISYDKKGVGAAVKRGLEINEKGLSNPVAAATEAKKAEPAPWELVDEYQGRTRAVTMTPHKHSIFGRKQSKNASNSSPVPLAAAVEKKTDLSLTTNSLKNEVEKLKAFLESSGADKDLKKENASLKAEVASWKNKLNAKEEECMELAKKLGEMVEVVKALGNGATGGEGVEEREQQWREEKASMLQRQQDLEKIVGQLTAALADQDDSEEEEEGKDEQ